MWLDNVRLASALRARWPVALLVCAAVLAAAIAFALLLPPRYEATATVVAEMSGTDPIRGQEIFKPAGAVSTYIATQVEIIRSEAVALGALHVLGLDKDPGWRERWQRETEGRGSFESWMAAQLLRKLAVQPARDSNALNVSFVSPDAAFSAAVANAFVKSYIETTLQMRARPARQFNVFFEERAKPLRDALEQAKARLSAYERSHGLVVSDTREPDVESKRLADLNAQLVALQDAAAEAANRQRQAASEPSRMREVRNDPEVVQLSTDLVLEEGRMARLRTEFGEHHPLVVKAQQSIDNLRQRLSSAMRRAAASLSVPVKANEARLAEVRAAIARQRALVLQRQSQRDAAAVLLRDVDNAQKAYDAVLARASQTALEAANTIQESIAVVRSATPPARPSSLLLLNASVAMLLGPLLGMAVALVMESRDRRLRTSEDVTHLLGQPLLLALPDGGVRRGKAARRAAETQQRLVAVRPRLAPPR